MDADQFILSLQAGLSPLVDAERTVYAQFQTSLAREGGSVYVDFVNLPTPRVEQRRGGGAESENNRTTFWIRGFDKSPADDVDEVRVEQAKNGIYGPGSPSREGRSPNLRSRTGSPEKIAAYLARYINDVAENYPPSYTHD
jgi:hypothetical protein